MMPQEPDQEDVRKLLRWKRNEQPPPGYFISFSDKVLARLEAEETTEQSGWWDWLVGRFDARPVLVCAYGVAVSSLLFFGFRLSQAFEAEVSAGPAVPGQWLAITPSSPILRPTQVPDELVAGTASSALFTGTRFALQEDNSSVFFPRGSMYLQQAGFSVSGR